MLINEHTFVFIIFAIDATDGPRNFGPNFTIDSYLLLRIMTSVNNKSFSFFSERIFQSNNIDIFWIIQ